MTAQSPAQSQTPTAVAQRLQEAQVASEVVQQLLGNMDPEHLTLQLRNNVLTIDLFHSIANAMKHHCAPARDDLVDDSVYTAEEGQVGLGFRGLFETAEAMKVVSDQVGVDKRSRQPADRALGHCQSPSTTLPTFDRCPRSQTAENGATACARRHLSRAFCHPHLAQGRIETRPSRDSSSGPTARHEPMPLCAKRRIDCSVHRRGSSRSSLRSMGCHARRTSLANQPKRNSPVPERVPYT